MQLNFSPLQPVALWVGQGWGGKIRILTKGAPLKARIGLKGAPLKAYSGAPFQSAFFGGIPYQNLTKFEFFFGFVFFRNIRKCERSEQEKFATFFIEMDCVKPVNNNIEMQAERAQKFRLERKKDLQHVKGSDHSRKIGYEL